MKYVGLDYHKKTSHVAVRNEGGALEASVQMSSRPEEIGRFLSSQGERCRVVVEAGRCWERLYESLSALPVVERVVLAHPLKVRAIAEAKIKTDRIDAETLSNLLRGDLIPEAYIPSRETRELKQWVRQRMFLVRLSTRVKNRTRILLERAGVPLPPASDLFGVKAMAYLRRLELPDPQGACLRQNLDLLDRLRERVKDLESRIEAELGGREEVERLRTVPGLGPILSAVVALEVERIERFASAAKLVSYAGLAPTTYASGGRLVHGRLIPSCNKWLRGAFVEAAWAAARFSPALRIYFEPRRRRLGSSKAIVAVARRLCTIVWHIWRERRPFTERPPRKGVRSPAVLQQA